MTIGASLHHRKNLSAVGQSGLPEGINTWIYRSICRNLKRFEQRHDPTSVQIAAHAGDRVWNGVLDRLWQVLGWQVDGCDLVADAVTDAQEAHPAARLWVADVSSAEGIMAEAPAGGGRGALPAGDRHQCAAPRHRGLEVPAVAGQRRRGRGARRPSSAGRARTDDQAEAGSLQPRKATPVRGCSPPISIPR